MAIPEELPLEVLALCFLPLPLWDRVIASHVSQRWRTAALTCPELWNTLSFNHRPGKREALLAMLERSGAGPLDATWVFRRPYFYGSEILAANMWRVKRLTFIVHHDEPGQSQRIPEVLLMVSAPMLEVLHADLAVCFTIPAQWDDRGAPRLREIMVNSFAFDAQCRRFSALRRFRGDLPDREDRRIPLHGMFKHCPRLVELELGGFSRSTEHFLPRGPIPSTLTRLAFFNCKGAINYGPLLESMMGLPQSLTLPHADDFCPAMKLYDTYGRDQFAIMCRVVRTPVSAEPPKLDAFSIHLHDCHSNSLSSTIGDLRVALDCVEHAAPHLGNLGHLDCPAEFFDRLLRLRPTLPALQSLTLVVEGRRPFGDLNYCRFQRSGHVVVPQLRTLFIDTTDIDQDFAASAHSWFLHTLPQTLPAWLHLGQPKLAAAHLFLSQELVSSVVATSPEVLFPLTERVFIGWRDGWEREIEGRGKWYPDPSPGIGAPM